MTEQTDRKRIVNQLALVESARQGDTHLVTYPSIASVGLTLKCNLSCIMCFTRDMERTDMNMEYLEKLEGLFPYLNEVRWNDAGELFASSKSRQYLDYINAHPVPQSSVSTSFTLAHRFFDEIFGGGITHLSVSMDGAVPETYESIRQGASFKKVMENLNTLKNRKEESGLSTPHLMLVFIAMKRNIHELSDYVELANSVNAETIHVLRLLPGPAHVELTEQVDATEEREHYRRALQKADEYNIIMKHVVLENKEFMLDRADGDKKLAELCNIPVQAFTRPFSGFRDTLPYCLAPWQETVVGVDGEIRPCCFMEREMGHLKDQDFLAIWNGDRYQDLRHKLYTGDYCYCRDCPWVKKYFAYYRSPTAKTRPPWENFLKRMEQYAQLDQDCCPDRYGRFPRENDPLHFAINKYWQVMPDQSDSDRDNSEQDEQEQTGAGKTPSHGSGLNRLKNWLYSSSSEMKDDYRDQIRTLFEDQQRFNAAIVQYLNMISDRFNTTLTRQVHFNQETTISSNMMTSRIDQADKDIQGLLNVIFDRADVKNTGEPLNIEAIFYRAEYCNVNLPENPVHGSSVTLQLDIVNTSLSIWNAGDSKGSVLFSVTMLDDEDVPVVSGGTETMLENDLVPGGKISLSIPVQIPDKKGEYILSAGLVCKGIAGFNQCGVPEVKMPIHVV